MHWTYATQNTACVGIYVPQIKNMNFTTDFHQMAVFCAARGLFLINDGYFIFPKADGYITIAYAMNLLTTAGERRVTPYSEFDCLNPMSIKGCNINERLILKVDVVCCKRIIYTLAYSSKYTKLCDLDGSITYLDIQNLLADVSQQLY
jgi:hypothetical protein